SPNSQSCINPAARPAVIAGLGGGATGTALLAAIDLLDTLNDLGSTQDVYKQKSRNWALFTHNIFHVTDKFDVTFGVRYTNERKKFDAEFGNDNSVCTTNQANIGAFLASAALFPTVSGILGLSCQGNSTAELNGVQINDKRKE